MQEGLKVACGGGSKAMQVLRDSSSWRGSKEKELKQ
jgi:hypothetical protein